MDRQGWPMTREDQLEEFGYVEELWVSWKVVALAVICLCVLLILL